MAQTTSLIAAAAATAAIKGKHPSPPATANVFAGTQGGVAAPPTRQVLGTGVKGAWKSRLPVPIKKNLGGAAGEGTAKGATATGSGLSNLLSPPRRILSGGASKLPIPTRKTPGGASVTPRLPPSSLKTPRKAASPPPKETTPQTPLPHRQVPGLGVVSPAASKVKQNTKAKSPTPPVITRTANDCTRKMAPPKDKLPSVATQRLSPAKRTQRQNRAQPPPKPAPAATVTTSIAPVVVPTVSVSPRVFVPLPSTYHRVEVCEGKSFKPLPTRLQQIAGARYLKWYRLRSAEKPGCPQLRAKRVVAPGEYSRQKPLPGASPLSKCLSEEEVVTRKLIRVRGKVVAPHLGPKGRPELWWDPDKTPIAIRMHRHRKMLREGWSPWGPYLRDLEDGEQ